jgi:hypothetical protein
LIIEFILGDWSNVDPLNRGLPIVKGRSTTGNPNPRLIQELPISDQQYRSKIGNLQPGIEFRIIDLDQGTQSKI